MVGSGKEEGEEKKSFLEKEVKVSVSASRVEGHRKEFPHVRLAATLSTSLVLSDWVA